MRKRYLFLCLAVGLISACKKEIEYEMPSVTQSSLLTGSQWREVGHSVNSVASTSTSPTGGNLYDLMLPCELDNILTFNADNTFVYDEGPTLCRIIDPQRKTGAWEFAKGSDERMLYVILPNASIAPREGGPYLITELTSTTLALRHTKQLLQGQSVEEITYKAIQ